jgi:hypothetical protein
MIRRIAALAVLMLVFAGTTSASADITPTRLHLSLTLANGTPMRSADVQVYYLTPHTYAVGTPCDMSPIGSGTSDVLGNVNLLIDTSTVDQSDLGNTGTGVNDAFNALVVAEDQARNFIVAEEILRLQGTVNVSEQADLSAVGEPNPGQPNPVTCRVVSSSYRYIRLVAFNSARGLDTNLSFTFNSGTSRQVQAGIALKYAGQSWQIGSNIMEETSRSTTGGWLASGAYHKVVWANYYWLEYRFDSCGRFSCKTWWEWHLNHFNGQVSEYNPNTGPSGSVIGIVNYIPPAYDPDPNHHVVLTSSSPPEVRDYGQYHSYGFSLDVAGFLSLTDIATYGNITSMTWAYNSGGCTGTRVLWGNGADVASTDIVQASCV